MKTVKYRIGEHDLILETGKMAKQANGSVVARYAGSSVLATVCCSSSPVEGLDYVPLSVDYNEKYYAAGKIPGGFLKREARPKDKEILVSRLIDRPMRPLFHKAFGREIQVVPTTISADKINPPDVVGMMAAFATVMISDIPFNGPVAAVRVACVDGNMIINPKFEEIEKSSLDIIVAGSNDGICMVEGGAKEVSEELMIQAIEMAEKEINGLCQFLSDFQAEVGKEKLSFVPKAESLDFKDEIITKYGDAFQQAVFVKGKFERRIELNSIKKEAADFFADKISDDNKKAFSAVFEDMERDIMRLSVLEKGIRCDGRKADEIRPISCEVDLLERTHGSALFTRGETQSLGVTTLGTIFDEQIMDDIDGDRRENFMLHYNFPPYSVGETGRLGTGRREIGHGHLAHRALLGVMPKKDVFPYTTRIVSEVLESNGSSSMATVCSGTLSLLDAGVPIKNPVAGIAMGLIKHEDNAVILSDILGEEDHMGDMDFKVAGTKEGITAFQMDIKISGISRELMNSALNQAHEGRMHILGKMSETLDTYQDRMSDYAPKIITMKIDQDKIGMVIGPGGKTIKMISEKSSSKVNIDEDGTLTIFSANKAAADAAKEIINGIIHDPEIGQLYHGTVKRLVDFGAFVEILPGKEGLCHISRISATRIASVKDVVKEGQGVDVRIIEIDRMGRFNLSMVDVDEEVWKKSPMYHGAQKVQRKQQE